MNMAAQPHLEGGGHVTTRGLAGRSRARGLKQTLQKVGCTLQAVLQVRHDQHLQGGTPGRDHGPGPHTHLRRCSTPLRYESSCFILKEMEA